MMHGKSISVQFPKKDYEVLKSGMGEGAVFVINRGSLSGLKATLSSIRDDRSFDELMTIYTECYNSVLEASNSLGEMGEVFRAFLKDTFRNFEKSFKQGRAENQSKSLEEHIVDCALMKINKLLRCSMELTMNVSLEKYYAQYPHGMETVSCAGSSLILKKEITNFNELNSILNCLRDQEDKKTFEGMNKIYEMHLDKARRFAVEVEAPTRQLLSKINPKFESSERFQNDINSIDDKIILVATRLLTSDACFLKLEKVKGIVCMNPSTDHIVDVIRERGIPTIRAGSIKLYLDAKTMILNTYEEPCLIKDPKSSDKEAFLMKLGIKQKKATHEQVVLSKPSITADGEPFVLSVTVNDQRPMTDASEVDLVRLEMLLWNLYKDGNVPCVEEIENIIVETFKDFNKPIKFRLIDFSPDKTGILKTTIRGLVHILDNQQDVKTYREVIYALKSAMGKLKRGTVDVMAPMVRTSEEITRLSALLKPISPDDKIKVNLGCMVETPDFLKNFLSITKENNIGFLNIGLGDLLHYTLNRFRYEKRDYDMDSHTFDPVMLFMMIKIVELSASEGRNTSIPIGVCGFQYSAVHSKLAMLFYAMGIRSIALSGDYVKLKEELLEEKMTLYKDFLKEKMFSLPKVKKVLKSILGEDFEKLPPQDALVGIIDKYKLLREDSEMRKEVNSDVAHASNDILSNLLNLK